jgi:outer membrane cobalamin receptor
MVSDKAKSNLTLSVISALLSLSGPVFAEEAEEDYFSLSLDQLANIKVITSSKREQSIDESYANVTVITKEMLARRGYRNLIEMLEDLPGFDFATYEDGGGEYPVHLLDRGTGGDNGNSRMMVMIDGMVQNHVSFNWTQGLTDEQMLLDIERIEIVQGPGSALYGAQAVAGIVHIITKKKFDGINAKLLLGENNTQGFEMIAGSAVGNTFYQIALKRYISDGDGGVGRYDPGEYFNNNYYPDVLIENYDENGNYVTNVANYLAGQAIPDGFNNSKDDKTVRLRVLTDNLEMGINYWERKDGLGSYVTGYEYNATAEDFISHHSSFAVYIKNQKVLIENKLKWNSDLWYRVDKQEADTGFSYTYRFNELKKSYHSASSQVGFENQFDLSFDDDKTLIFGFRFLGNRQTEQVISLGEIQSGNASTTTSSWDIAAAGNGLGNEKVNEIFDETETALYVLLEGEFTSDLSYSFGNRYSNGSDYGSTNTPRAGLIYSPDKTWTLKALYGSAYRQPSLFELHDEFRGHNDLVPESIDTFEIEVSHRFNEIGNLKFNLFHSSLDDSINLVEDLTRAGGERYANVESSQVRGLSTQIDLQPSEKLTIYANYFFQQGALEGESWGDVDHTARHKINMGVNWQPLSKNFNINLRANYVGERKVPITNLYFSDKAPGYTKFDLVLTWANLFEQKGLETQLIVNNLLDESYFGVGRQSGSSLRSDYDPATNPNPIGFIPAYHPQAGRTIYWNVSYNL